jgi:hypothetical protein
VVDKVALRQDILRVLRFPPASIFPPVHSSHHHRFCQDVWANYGSLSECKGLNRKVISCSLQTLNCQSEKCKELLVLLCKFSAILFLGAVLPSKLQQRVMTC